ncbi:alpha/beta hydrolase family protein [Tenacibaculum sp. A30]|uniref:alpha/beta hydrolase family protein n=1 Tax=Tenacibaculum sp. A30 TaxID=3442644 RepID=UPI003EBA1A5E
MNITKESLIVLFLFLNININYSQILNSKNIKIQDLSLYSKITYLDDDNNLKYLPNYKHLENIKLDSINYFSDSLKIKGYIMYPKNTRTEMPLIIFNRGGNRNFGNLTPSLMIYHLSLLSSKGFIIAGSTYRGNNDSQGKDEFGGKDVNDIINLISLLKESKKVNSSKIALYGWSRGGIMTYLSLKELKSQNIIKTAIIGGSPSNLFYTIKNRPEMEKKVFSQIIPKYNSDKNKVLTERSVLFWVNELPKIPLLIFHGLNDEAVDVNQTLDLAKKLKAYQIPYKLIIYENDKHNVRKNKNEMDLTILNWLNKYL